MVIIKAVLAVFFVAAALAVLTALPVMLLWGAIAGTYGWPTMGFGTAAQVCVLFSILGSVATSSSSK